MIKKKLPLSKKKLIAIGAGVFAIVLLGGGYLYHKHTTKPPQITTAPSTTQSEDIAAAQQGVAQKNATSSTQSTTQTDKQAGASSPASGSANKPEGNFVSNHHVSSLNEPLESVCTTSRGATCEITFKSGGTVKSVGVKDVNQAGSAIWAWTPASIGLTAGSWQIIAIATLNGNQVTATDPMNLEVSQ